MGHMKALAIDLLNEPLDAPMDRLGTLVKHHVALPKIKSKY